MKLLNTELFFSFRDAGGSVHIEIFDDGGVYKGEEPKTEGNYGPYKTYKQDMIDMMIIIG